jgi:hypothetical protein
MNVTTAPVKERPMNTIESETNASEPEAPQPNGKRTLVKKPSP